MGGGDPNPCQSLNISSQSFRENSPGSPWKAVALSAVVLILDVGLGIADRLQWAMLSRKYERMSDFFGTLEVGIFGVNLLFLICLSGLLYRTHLDLGNWAVVRATSILITLVNWFLYFVFGL